MLTIKSKEIKNNAYDCLVSIVAFSEGYQVKVVVQYCTPYFRCLDSNEEDMNFLSREEAEKEFEVEVEWSLMLSIQALKAQEKFMQKCMNDKASLENQKAMEAIHNCLRKEVPLELGKLAAEASEYSEVLIYQYFSLLVVEYFTEEGFGINLVLNGEVIHGVYTMDDGTISAEAVLKSYFE